MAGISFDSIELLSATIDFVVDRIMQEEIADGLKQEVKRKAQTNVYDAHSPKFKSRYGESGGILDESLMNTSYSNLELRLEHDVPWQNLGTMPRKTGRGTGDNKLVDVIEHNAMYSAKNPRP